MPCTHPGLLSDLLGLPAPGLLEARALPVGVDAAFEEPVGMASEPLLLLRLLPLPLGESASGGRPHPSRALGATVALDVSTVSPGSALAGLTAALASCGPLLGEGGTVDDVEGLAVAKLVSLAGKPPGPLVPLRVPAVGAGGCDGSPELGRPMRGSAWAATGGLSLKKEPSPRCMKGRAGDLSLLLVQNDSGTPMRIA